MKSMKKYAVITCFMSLVACENAEQRQTPPQGGTPASEKYEAYSKIDFKPEEADVIVKQDLTQELGISLDNMTCEEKSLTCEDERLVCVEK